jgi:class 3 adenylate cyclase/predicted ATPase
MKQIADWLEQLGLGQYAERFAENDITVAILPDLTDQDLKELGVASLGHRRQLLRAIGERNRLEQGAPRPAISRASPVASYDTAERRQVTVMFSDLVGSTALSTRMDPEDLREVISGYQKCVAETVGRFGGFVAKYMGDGVLVYFGYPQAHEDDAERAVRAGLELAAAVSGLKTHAALQARVGIATGLVVVGDLIGSGASQEQAIVGETPNLAARLQGVAEPNGVVIAQSTRRLLGDLFELEDLGEQNLKGVETPVPAWAALRSSSIESRFEALHPGGVTALVGREEELELLLRRWSGAKTGEGQVILLSGEAGIGKSRLTAALLERLADEPHTRLRYFCSPQHTDSALYPIIGHMERAAGFRHDDTSQVKRHKLDAVLAQTSTSIEDVALLAEMLSLPNDGRYPALELTSQRRRERTLEALVSQLAALTRENPVLMIVEDAHWIDPTSLEVIGRVVARIETLPVLLIVTFRPEFGPPWIGQPYVTAVTLNRLTQRDVGILIKRVLGDKLLPVTIQQDIIERTDGIPLFVEEMTKAVLEAESEGDAQRTAAAVPTPGLRVPASLHASLMARLDRLGLAKEVAQVGSAIGREFPHVILAAVVRMPEAELSSALHTLIATGLLFRQGTPPHATYLFKHALVQDAAYGTLLREPRRALHARIAQTLESQFPDIAESRPELLARHCAESGLIEKAARLWGKAGERSLERSALVEAAEQLTRALGQIGILPGTPALRREQIKVQMALTNALMHTKGFAAPETKASLDQARSLIERIEALSEPLEDPLALFSILYGFWVVNYVAFNGDVVCSLATQFLANAEKRRATVPLMIGHRIMGASLLYTGDIVQGREHQDLAIALYDPVEHGALATRFGVDIEVAVLPHRSLALWLLGCPESALADTDRALKNARKMGQDATLMYALAMSSITLILCGKYETASTQADELIALADEKRAPFWKAFGMMNRGSVLAFTGEASNAVELITSGISLFRSTGATGRVSWYLLSLAWAYAGLERIEDAWRSIGEATIAVETTKEKWCEADLNRIAGEIELISSARDTTKTEAYFERAITIAREQQAKSWELRAVMSVARMWRDHDKRQDASDLLAQVYGRFTEGFDTPDLRRARALLNELAW